MLTPLLIVWLAAATPIEQAQRAVMEGQAALQQQRFEDAARFFEEGVNVAEAIPDEETRTQALAAMHFYSGVAHAALGRESRTREAIEWFLVYSPSTKSVDPAQFPKAFVEAFGEVAETVRANPLSEFDSRYPGFRHFSAEEPSSASVALWGDSPEAVHLATEAEQNEWKKLRDEAARQAFVQRFWERRDPTRGTEENEFRALFGGRVAFADRTFGGENGERGSLTDRGRVLILLGKPREVMYERIDANSEAEIWGYRREQLPVRIRDHAAMFRFIDDITRYYVMPFSAEAERILTSAAAKARK
ncbi:MAG: GWxTD domain-containing protein [Thermoanaerobaculia bacterium]